ncbi:hypothetical protein [Larkinella knui]|nr:hypothetical protein [Larkinella knui]
MEPSPATITFASSKQPAAINGSSTPINMFQFIAQKSTIARLKALVATSKTALYLAASLSVFSCQETSPVHPDGAQSPTSTVARNQARLASPAALKKYRLIQWGEQTLTYYPDGRIKRSLFGPDVAGNDHYRQSYSYSAGILSPSGTVEVRYSRSVPDSRNMRETYWYNDTGHCYKYKQVVDEGVNGVHTYTSILAYNSKGQMTDCLFGSGRAHYDYNADGDLVKVTFLNAQLVPTETHTLSYTPSNGGPPVNDLYPLHSEWMEPFEHYLPYFGQPSKHLVQSVVIKRLYGQVADTNVFYSYVRNADGYVTQRKTYHKLGGAPIETKQYEYEITLINIPN